MFALTDKVYQLLTHALITNKHMQVVVDKLFSYCMIIDVMSCLLMKVNLKNFDWNSQFCSLGKKTFAHD
jgi:hypothetical protein